MKEFVAARSYRIIVLSALCLLLGGSSSRPQDGASGKPRIDKICPADFLAGYTASFVVIGGGFQPGVTTVKLNGVPQPDVVVLSPNHLIFSSNLAVGGNGVEVGTPGGGTGVVPIVGRTIEDLSVVELFACAIEVARILSGVTPPQMHKELLKPFEAKLDEAHRLFLEFSIRPAINIVRGTEHFLRAHLEKKLTQLGFNALMPFLTVLVTKMQDTELQCVLPDVVRDIDHSGAHISAKASLQGIVGYNVDAKTINDGIKAAIDEDQASQKTKGHTFEKKLRDIKDKNGDPEQNDKANKLLTFPAAWTIYGGCRGVGASLFGNGVGKVVNKRNLDSPNPDKEVPRTDAGAGQPVLFGIKDKCKDKITLTPKGSGPDGKLAADQETFILSETVMAVQAFAFVTVSRDEINATLQRFATAPIPDNDAALSASMKPGRDVANAASTDPFSAGPGTAEGRAHVGGKAGLTCTGEKTHQERLDLAKDGKPAVQASLKINNPKEDDKRVSCSVERRIEEVFCEKKNGKVTVEGVVEEFGGDIFSVHRSVSRVRFQVYFASFWVAILKCSDGKHTRERLKVGGHVHFAGLAENPAIAEDSDLLKALKAHLQAQGVAGDEDGENVLKPPKGGFNKAQIEKAMKDFAHGGKVKEPTKESLLGKALEKFDKCPK